VLLVKRVLLVSWEYPPVIEGGLARHVRKLSEELVRQGVAVDVLTRGADGSEGGTAQARERGTEVQVRGGVTVHRVREPSWPRDLDRFVGWVERMNEDMLLAGTALAEEHCYDLVHGHDWLVANACDHLAKRFEAPLVTTIHATEHGRHQGWVDKHPQTYIHGVERWITNRSERVIACSHYMREQIADIFGVEEERVSVIPNGIDPGDLQPQDPAELERLRAEFAAPEEKLVLLIGRLVYEKGFQLALEAMPRVIAEAPGTRFLVAGSGTHEEELHRQAEELGLMDHGTFLGWIGDDVLHSLYRIADLTVVPSIYEPFGLVALEAMASECPCIVADTGGLREVVPHEEVGLRFRSHDPDALAEVAIRVLRDDELGHRLVAEAYEHLRRFDWGDVAEQTAAVYADLVGEASRGLSR
jgi:glycogen synthase